MRELLNRLPRQHKISGAHRASGRATRNLRSVVKPSEIIKMQKGSGREARGPFGVKPTKRLINATYKLALKLRRIKVFLHPSHAFYDATMKLDTVALCLVCDASAL